MPHRTIVSGQWKNGTVDLFGTLSDERIFAFEFARKEENWI